MYIDLIGPINKNVYQLLLTCLYQTHALLALYFFAAHIAVGPKNQNENRDVSFQFL
jgi:fructose-specific phosphotransferase system IIC component